MLKKIECFIQSFKLEEIKEKTGSDAVTLKIGKNYYRVIAVESTPGTPKSDFHFRDIEGRMVGFVSHKDGLSATARQKNKRQQT